MTFFTFPIVPLMAESILLKTEDTAEKMPFTMVVTVLLIPFQIVEMVLRIEEVIVVITFRIAVQTVVNTD